MTSSNIRIAFFTMTMWRVNFPFQLLSLFSYLYPLLVYRFAVWLITLFYRRTLLSSDHSFHFFFLHSNWLSFRNAGFFWFFEHFFCSHKITPQNHLDLNKPVNGKEKSSTVLLFPNWLFGCHQMEPPHILFTWKPKPLQSMHETEPIMGENH